jgi:hypothetical protein
MAGRKRKDAARTPSGQISRAGQESSLSPIAVKRLLTSAIAKASDPRLGSEIGRLLLHGKLTTRQASAAWRYAEISASYQTAIHAPKCKTARLERGQKAEAPEDGTAAGDAITAKTRRAISRYIRADAILNGCGQDAARAVSLLVADIALIGHKPLVDAKDALDALAAHFGGERDKAR